MAIGLVIIGFAEICARTRRPRVLRRASIHQVRPTRGVVIIRELPPGVADLQGRRWSVTK